MQNAIELRSRYQHFRVLVMGKANAGKTTILQAVCGTREKPQIYNQRGRRIRAKDSILSPTSFRGVHDIEYELRFSSNPGFVFHDSRGFEAGGTDELDKVRAFIDSRAAERSVDKQLHAIWFCLPTDHDARMITAAELDFFERCDTGKVPVIAIFTKFDSLDGWAYQELRREGFKHSEAQEGAPRRADEHFERVHLGRIFGQKYPPKKELRVRNMHEVVGKEEEINKTVTELIKKTSDALDTDALKLLLATVQNNNIEVCMENAVNGGSITACAQRVLESGIFPQGRRLEEFLWNVASHYPYVWIKREEMMDRQIPLTELIWMKIFDILELVGAARKAEALAMRTPIARTICLVNFGDGSLSQLIDGILEVVAEFLPRLNGGLPLPLQALNLGACIAICCGVLCLQRSGTLSAQDFQGVFEHYEQSGVGNHVREAIVAGFDEIGSYDTVEQNAKLLQIVLDNKLGPVPK